MKIYRGNCMRQTSFFVSSQVCKNPTEIGHLSNTWIQIQIYIHVHEIFIHHIFYKTNQALLTSKVFFSETAICDY